VNRARPAGGRWPAARPVRRRTALGRAGTPAGRTAWWRRPALLARAGWGLSCLVAPRAVGRVLGLDPADRWAHRLLRLLGARDLGQAALPATAPPRALLRLGSAVDALHATSMYALAALRRDYRRPALTAAAIATTWAAASLREGDGRGDADGGRPGRD
jgi:hypothetical protein